ncbi:hypothetical protein WAI453_006009 [Rhynchosporium graminicola]
MVKKKAASKTPAKIPGKKIFSIIIIAYILHSPPTPPIHPTSKSTYSTIHKHEKARVEKRKIRQRYTSRRSWWA